jgi:sugar/nucleoside kinase (ribokinase family)
LIGVVGNLSRDRLDGGTPRVGGGPFHCGRALRVLGTRAVLVTKTADPELLRPLVRLGLPVRWQQASATAAFRIDYEGEDRRMIVEALGDAWSPEDARGWVADALRGAAWIHVAPLSRGDFPPETLAELARGRRLSLDGQGLVRAPVTGPLHEDADYDPAVLVHVSILKLSEEEARLLFGGIDERLLRLLQVPEVVVTLGSRGAIVFVDGLADRIPARPAPETAELTGCGDMFAAVYLASRAGGHAPVAAAHRATAVVADLLCARAGFAMKTRRSGAMGGSRQGRRERS